MGQLLLVPMVALAPNVDSASCFILDLGQNRKAETPSKVE
jgi:hypothetical protein